MKKKIVNYFTISTGLQWFFSVIFASFVMSEKSKFGSNFRRDIFLRFFFTIYLRARSTEAVVNVPNMYTYIPECTHYLKE